MTAANIRIIYGYLFTGSKYGTWTAAPDQSTAAQSLHVKYVNGDGRETDVTWNFGHSPARLDVDVAHIRKTFGYSIYFVLARFNAKFPYLVWLIVGLNT